MQEIIQEKKEYGKYNESEKKSNGGKKLEENMSPFIVDDVRLESFHSEMKPEQKVKIKKNGVKNEEVSRRENIAAVQKVENPSPVVQKELPDAGKLAVERTKRLLKETYTNTSNGQNEFDYNYYLDSYIETYKYSNFFSRALWDRLIDLKDRDYLSLIEKFYREQSNEMVGNDGNGIDRGRINPDSSTGTRKESLCALRTVLTSCLLEDRDSFLKAAIEAGDEEQKLEEENATTGEKIVFKDGRPFNLYSKDVIRAGGKQFQTMVDRRLPKVDVKNTWIGGVTSMEDDNTMWFGLAGGRSQAVHEFGHLFEKQFTPNEMAMLHNFLRARSKKDPTKIGWSFLYSDSDTEAYDAELPNMDFINPITRNITTIPTDFAAPRLFENMSNTLSEEGDRMMQGGLLSKISGVIEKGGSFLAKGMDYSVNLGTTLARGLAHTWNALNFFGSNAIRYGASLPVKYTMRTVLPRDRRYEADNTAAGLVDEFFLKESNRESTHYATNYDESGNTEFISTTAELLSTIRGAEKLINADPLRVTLFIYFANRNKYEEIKNKYEEKKNEDNANWEDLDKMIHVIEC